MNLKEKLRVGSEVSREELHDRKTVELTPEELERLTKPCFFFGYSGVRDPKCLECENAMNRLTCDKYIPFEWKQYVDLISPLLPPPEKSQ
ncbi:MAG: hypothetical protein KAT77_01330 [Nanoarchaeota archaeon]|nr:hypothetical protein [Nanoarchaeota archaeon]